MHQPCWLVTMTFDLLRSDCWMVVTMASVGSLNNPIPELENNEQRPTSSFLFFLIYLISSFEPLRLRPTII